MPSEKEALSIKEAKPPLPVMRDLVEAFIPDECEAEVKALKWSQQNGFCIKSCAAGEKRIGGSCEECPAGYVSQAGASQCTPCGTGSYSLQGMAKCLPCSGAEYAETNGSHVCSLCPSNTRRGAGTLGVHKKECVRAARVMQKIPHLTYYIM